MKDINLEILLLEYIYIYIYDPAMMQLLLDLQSVDSLKRR